MPCSATTPSIPNVNFAPAVIPSAPFMSPGVPTDPAAGTTPDDGSATGGTINDISPMTCNDWPEDGYDGQDIYSQKISNNFTLGDLTIGGAPGPRRIIGGCLKPYKVIPMSFAVTGKQPVQVTAQQIACHLSILGKNLLDPIDEYVKSQSWRLSINSGFRSGSNQSDHGLGLAADLNITDDGSPITETQRRTVMEWILSNLGPKVRQILFEKSSANSPLGWIHVSATTPNMGDRGASKVGTLIGPSYAWLTGLPGTNGYTLL